MVIEKTNNLYENWVKKPEMIFIIEILNNINVFKTNQNLIYMIMIKTIYHNIYNHFNLLTTDKYQLKYYQTKLNKIYNNLTEIYNIKYYKLYNYGIQYYYYIYQVNNNLNLLIEYDINSEYLSIESFFRGIHQIIEINLLYLIKQQDEIEKFINIDNEYVKELIYNNLLIWNELIDLLNLLSSLDELQYQKYRNLIYGTSGGESINLRKIQKRIQDLDKKLKLNIYDTIINNTIDKYLISFIKLYQYYSTQFWLTHFNLASSTNGIQNKGTKETPIIQLIDKCINMTSTNINNEIYNVSIKVTDDTFKKKIKLNEKEKTIGISIYNSSKKIFNK